MANVMLALRTTTSDALNTVSSTTKVINNGAVALSDLTATGAAHAAHYRRTTEAELSLSADEFDTIAVDRAKLRIARARFAMDQELGRTGPDAKTLAQHYDSIELVTNS